MLARPSRGAPLSLSQPQSGREMLQNEGERVKKRRIIQRDLVGRLVSPSPVPSAPKDALGPFRTRFPAASRPCERVDPVAKPSPPISRVDNPVAPMSWRFPEGSWANKKENGDATTQARVTIHERISAYFFNASARVVMVTFISTFSFGLSLPSRGTATILSATSMPAITLPNTV